MKKILLVMVLGAMALVRAGAVDITDPNLIWDGSTIEDFYADPEKMVIYIYTPGQFMGLHDKWDNYEPDGHHGYDNWTIYLMNDIDLNNNNIQPLTIGWTSSHRFAGRFDGQGHTIKNVYIGGEEDDRGLFGWMCGGDVVNLRLENVTIVAGDGGNEHVGAICGRMDNHSLISHCAVVNCTVSVSDVNDGQEVGTICGYMANDMNTIEYCYSDATVSGESQVGGIVGKVENDGDGSQVRYCYFSGKIEHTADEYFGAIAGERYGNKLEKNFYLDRGDGVKGTGNQSEYQGSSDDPDAAGITDEQLKAPLLFGDDDAEWIYPLGGYPELKVFLRYNPGDSFYTKNVGHMGNNEADSIPGYLSAVSKMEVEKQVDIITVKEITFCTVALEKAIGATSTNDFVVNGNLHTYFSQIPLTTVGLGANAFENLGEVNRVLLPETLDSIAYPQRHSVQDAFVLSNDCAGCTVQDDALYDVKHRYLLTAPKKRATLTIHQELADNIADYAFEGMAALKTLYVDTWVEAGRTVDDSENRPPVFELKGEHAFDGCPADLDVFIKDGTAYQLFLGYQASGGYGYSNADHWKEFYSDYQDQENHMFTYFPIIRNAGHMSTMILGYPVELPDGVTAWWAQTITPDNDTKKVTLKKIGSQIVPALTPVLLTYGGTGPLYLSRYEGADPGAATDFESNLFKGSVDPGGHKMTDSEMMSNFLTLGRKKGDSTYDNLGFYLFHPKNNVLPAYVAWIAVNDVPNNALTMEFDESEPTGLTPVPSPKGEGSEYYSLDGRKLQGKPTAKGLYIVNGRKVAIR